MAGSTQVKHGYAAMSFTDIARALGYPDPEGRGRTLVFRTYAYAMNKLRMRPLMLKRLLELAEARQRVLADQQR